MPRNTFWRAHTDRDNDCPDKRVSVGWCLQSGHENLEGGKVVKENDIHIGEPACGDRYGYGASDWDIGCAYCQ